MTTSTKSTTTSETAEAMPKVASTQAASAKANPWVMPDGGVAGAGFFGMKRFIVTAATLEYTSGGVTVPISGLNVLTVASATAKGGVVAYYDKSSNKLQLFRGSSEVSGTVQDLVVVFIGY